MKSFGGETCPDIENQQFRRSPCVASAQWAFEESVGELLCGEGHILFLKETDDGQGHLWMRGKLKVS